MHNISGLLNGEFFFKNSTFKYAKYILKKKLFMPLYAGVIQLWSSYIKLTLLNVIEKMHTSSSIWRNGRYIELTLLTNMILHNFYGQQAHPTHYNAYQLQLALIKITKISIWNLTEYTHLNLWLQFRKCWPSH